MKNIKWGMRKFKKSILVLAGCVILCSVPIMQDSEFVTCAMTKEEAERQKDEAEKNEKDAKTVLDSLEEQQQQLVQDIADLDAKTTDIQTKISAQEDEAEELQKEIDDTQKKLSEAQKAEDSQYNAMKQRIQYLYEEGSVEYVEALLTSISFSDMLNKSEYIVYKL